MMEDPPILMMKRLKIGTLPYGRGRATYYLNVKIRTTENGPELSMTGDTVIGATDVGGGQNRDDLQRVNRFAPGITPELVAKLLEVWETHHLNSMRAYCEHQRAMWNLREEITRYTYRMNPPTIRAQNELNRNLLNRLKAGEMVKLTPEELILITLPFEVVTDGDADASPDATLYSLHGQPKKMTAGWLRPEESPKGLLGQPCPECGYKYGSEWRYEPLPDDVLVFLRSLPGEGRLWRVK